MPKRQPPKKPRITTAKIYDALQLGLGDLNYRFDGIEQRFDDHIQATNDGLRKMGRRIDRTTNYLEKRINIIGAHVDDFFQLHTRMDREISTERTARILLEERVSKIESKLAT